ncbi:MAG: YjdF family protein [Clostridia bacterium]|nr:YjdF family protein [Clostridia bacterium]
MKTSLTVFFEDPFWVGVFERIGDGKLSVCKVTFGAEPKDYDVLEFILRHYNELIFSPAVKTETRQIADNPKRRIRNVRKQTESRGIGTKSQQALQMQREEMKTERSQISREQRDAEAQRRFEMKQLKKKEKRRGH